MPKADNPSRPSVHGQMLRGSMWMIAQRWAIRLTGVVSTIVLARLLTPSDFGIVAIAMIFVGMLEILNQTGQKLAIIRHAEPIRAHYDTAWTLSVLLGLLVGSAIVVLAPLTSLYFHEPRAIPVMQCLALRAVMGGFENIGVVDFRRDIRFDRFFLYNMYPKIVSFFVTITLAILWRNYWALVAGILSLQLVTIIASYVMHPYRPRFSFAEFSNLWSFSIWTLVRSIGIYFNAQVDQIVVGGTLNTASMGHYSVANDVSGAPSREINDPLVTVLYSAMSKLQGDIAEMRALYLRSLGWSAVVCISASVGVTLVAPDMVQVILGKKWLDVEPLMGWLALSAGVLGLSAAAYVVFDVLGKPYLGARMQWVRLIMLAAAVIPMGFLTRSLPAIAATRLAVTVIFVPTLFLAAGSQIDISPRQHMSALWRPMLAAAAMAVMVKFVHLISPAIPVIRLPVEASVGASTFTGVILVLWRLSGYPASPEQDVFAFFRRSWQKIVPRRAMP